LGLPTLLENRFVVSADNLFLVFVMTVNTICKIKKSSIFSVGWYGPIPKIKTLVSAYVNPHEKSVFKNKKTTKLPPVDFKLSLVVVEALATGEANMVR
jgi:hypothetical protein